MKKIIGFLSLFLTLSASVLIILKIWGVDVFSAEDYTRTAWTILASFIASIVLILLYSYFIKNHSKGYDIKGGKVAEKKLN